MDATVVLVTEDGQRVSVDRAIAAMMGIVQPLLAMPHASAELSLPLPVVKSPVLSKVVEFLGQHRNDVPKQENAAVPPAFQETMHVSDAESDEQMFAGSDVSDEDSITSNEEALFADYVAATTPWDQRFLDSMDLATLVEVTKAANYLNIPLLLDVCCRTIARQMTGLKAHELREKFNLPNDFTAEEEARMAAEFAWVDE